MRKLETGRAAIKIHRMAALHGIMCKKSPNAGTSLLVFQALFFSFRCLAIIAHASSSSSSDIPEAPFLFTGAACSGAPTGRTVTVAIEASFRSAGGGLADKSLVDGRRFSLFHGLTVEAVNVDALSIGLKSCGTVDTGRYREAIPMLLRSEGAIDGA